MPEWRGLKARCAGAPKSDCLFLFRISTEPFFEQKTGFRNIRISLYITTTAGSSQFLKNSQVILYGVFMNIHT